MKKLLAMTLAGVMAFSMTVFAAPSPSAGTVSGNTVSSSGSSSAAVTASAAYVDGIPAAVASAAAAEGKTVGEYINNAVVEVPGLESVTPIGQGGHVIINGAPSNITFIVGKPAATAVKAAKEQAAALGGKVLNVVEVKYSIAGFDTARVNYYMKGVKAGQLIKVYQLVKGEWVELAVAEIRENHVVVDMTSLGTLAFVEVPAAQ